MYKVKAHEWSGEEFELGEFGNLDEALERLKFVESMAKLLSDRHILARIEDRNGKDYFSDGSGDGFRSVCPECQNNPYYTTVRDYIQGPCITCGGYSKGERHGKD